MLAIERRNEILEKLQNERRVVVSELSQFYEVSEETIRRDLEKLVVDGYAIKSYGGAVINENSNIDLPFNVRKNRNVVGSGWRNWSRLTSRTGKTLFWMPVRRRCISRKR